MPEPRGVADGPGAAQEGIARVRWTEQLTEQASKASRNDVAVGAAVAAISSEAQDGWSWCQRHGYTHSVDPKTGEWARSGVCQACWKGTFSAAAIADRAREGAAQAAEFQAQVDRATAELERAERDLTPGTEPAQVSAPARSVEPRADKPAVGQGPDALSVAAYPDLYPEPVAPPAVPRAVEDAPARGPDDGPGDEAEDQLDAWIRRAGADS